MQFDVEVNGQARHVTVTRRDGCFVVALNGREWVVDVAQVDGHTMSLLIEQAAIVGDEVSGNGGAGAAVKSHEVSVAADPVTGQFVFGIGTMPIPVRLNARRRFGRKDEGGSGGSEPQRLVAPMPGKVLRILAAPGDTVVRRQPVVVIEAMKMENELRATRDGAVTAVCVAEGQSVEAGTLLAIITPA